MKNAAGNLVCVLIGAMGLVGSSQAQTSNQDALVFSLGLQHLYDSNFFRSPAEIEEQITRVGASISFRKQVSSQRLMLRAGGSQYRYAEQDVLDASALEGELMWHSQLTANISTQLDWRREETPVDKLEFIGKDLIAREDANARLSLGDAKRIGLIMGAHQLKARHSNVERRELDFQDEEFFSEVRYRMDSGAWIGLRYRNGNRQYEVLNLRNLDFDYRQWELEVAWTLTPKTKLTGLAGHFDRAAKFDTTTDNDSNGLLANIKLEWAVTEKLMLEANYRFSQPAIGETSDAPAQVADSSVLLMWQFSPKVQLGFGAGYAEFDYDERVSTAARTERNLTFTPVQISWSYSEAVSLRLTSQWMDRSSPVLERDYQGYSAALALALHF